MQLADFALQQMCDYRDRSTSNLMGLSIMVQEAVAIHPKPLQLVLQECLIMARGSPGHSGLLEQPRRSSPDLQCPTSQLKRFASKKFKPLRLFKYFLLREQFICFKEVIAVIFDVH